MDEIKPRPEETEPESESAVPVHREPPLTVADLRKLERLLIPLLNQIRAMLGKGPVAPWT